MKEDMNACLLNIISLPTVEDALIDWLLERSDITGFSSVEVNGHGSSVAGLSLLEQVVGHQKHVQFIVHTDTEVSARMIEQLRQKFPDAGLHYFLVPLLEAGKI